MIDTGNLMGSFSVTRSGEGWKITSSADYAPYHQFGTSKMPARPMLPFDDQGNLLDSAKEDVETAMMQGVARMAKRLGFTVK
jgi:phage gpG-like protein